MPTYTLNVNGASRSVKAGPCMDERGALGSPDLRQRRGSGQEIAVKVVLILASAVADPAVAIGGIGELGVPTFAPALANAYFKLTGTRQRVLPFFPNATMSD